MPLFAKTLLLACLTAPLAAQAATCSRQSPAHTVALLELYTSEGCSSCPPADRWLRELSNRFSAEQLVPLALHVDYWDTIGWKDRFADSRFSERQKQLSRFSGGGTIYTPEVFAGMKELRAWRNEAELVQRIKRINATPAGASITLQMSNSGADALEVQAKFTLAQPGVSGRVMQGVLVIYENRLSSEVRAGENHGARLQHDWVVRYWSTPVALDAPGGHGEWRQTIKLPADWQRANLGVAAFVQDVRAGEVLQAVSMPACV
jgi:hypothetical protein